MSFSRAKLQRFNDVQSCTPSPADYNVPESTKPIHGTISHSERFAEPKSPSVSEAGSVKSANSSLFRTPTQPKKKKQPSTTLPKVKTKEVFTHELEVLKDKVVELNNKDLFITDLVEQIDELKQRIAELEQTKLTLTAENAKIEAQLLELTSEHRNCEQILKECQAISEYNIIECEVEKNRIKSELAEKVKLLDEVRGEHETLARNREKSLVHSYELSISKFTDTIEALKKRVVESDNDVAQLKEELEECEGVKVKFESQCGELREEVDGLKKYVEEQDLRNESDVKQTEDRIKSVRNDLLRKLDEYKRTAEECNKQLRDELAHKTQQLNTQSLIIEQNAQLTEENRDLKQRTENADDVLKQLSALQEKSDSYYKYCEYYKAKAADYEKEIEEFANIRKKYIEQSGKYDDLQQKFERLALQNTQLQNKVSEQELLMGPFKKQLEEYEREHKLLLGGKSDAEMELKDMALKYAAILGHQNHKQKIRHLVDLKAKNLELMQSKNELESKVRAQEKTIEMLKKEAKAKPAKKIKSGNKENDGNLMNVSHCESPGGPLRERN